MGDIARVLKFIDNFKLGEQWAIMVATVEASPWHREANVAVHTEMCLAQYIARFAMDRSEQQNKIAMIALLYHDVGKPAAEEVLEKKDGTGMFRRYAGHEQNSAVTFMECYVRDQELQNILSRIEARAVRWIIEHHLPYGMTDKAKRQALRIATLMAFEDCGISDQTFFDCLRSDAAGRISDDHGQKLQNVENWIKEFRAIEMLGVQPPSMQSMHRMYILIGPSGSGKTTWRKKCAADALVISHDDMKIEFWRAAVDCPMPMSDSEVYETAWKYSTIDNEGEFKKFALKRQAEIMAKAKKFQLDVVIDIVNASKKKRTQFVDMGRKSGMSMVAIEFWNTLDTLVARQKTRGDKSVPASSIKAQMHATACAWVGVEVDHVAVEIGS